MPITGIGTITNEYGFYSLTLPEDVDEIIVSYTSAIKRKNTLQLSKNLLLPINCPLPSLTLANVVHPRQHFK
ncbi:MAG: hypothetical protein R2788_21640 [Saprospiraceae bacterium]